MTFRKTLLLFFLIIYPISSFAKNSKMDIVWKDFISPVTTNAKYIALSGTTLASILAFNDHDLNQKARRNTQYRRPLRDFGYFGEAIGWGYLNGIYSLGYLAHAYWQNDKLSFERFEMMTNASLFTLFWTSGLKTAIKSRRPGYPEENDSFPSGHSSMSFAFASLVTAEHGLYWGLPAYVMAAFISYSRLNDDFHWIQDVIAGAAIGASYGWGVYLNRRKKDVPFMFSVLPSTRGDGGFLTFSTTY